MYTQEELSKIIEDKCNNLPFDREPQGLFQPIKYIMENGGKRMRPLLTLLSANLFNDNINPAVGSAIAIEIFHNFTLLHDDIMDQSPMRRGRDTVHIKWNDNTAILSGDAMYPLAYATLCQEANSDSFLKLLQEFNKVTLEVCQGQQYDLDFEKSEDITIEDYMRMIHLKTAVLMASAIRMGAIASGADESQQQIMYDFGISLGLAFQIQDDFLDTYGDSNTFGKTIGQDIAVGKQTFLRISAMQHADAKQREIIKISRNYQEVRSVYDELNIKEITQQAIEHHYQQAIFLLNKAHDDRDRLKPLFDYSKELINRDK